MNRRQFIASTTGLLMAPALVRAASLEYVPRVVKPKGVQYYYRLVELAPWDGHQQLYKFEISDEPRPGFKPRHPTGIILA